MDPQIIDYYNEMPNVINVIDKMNEEFLNLQENFDIINKELQNYQTPKIQYNSKQEWNNKCNEVKNYFEKEITKIIIENQEYKFIYETHKCPVSIRLICEKALNKLTKNEKYENQSISKWSRTKSYQIEENINSFLQSMKIIPCPEICNENNLVKIICKNILWQYRPQGNILSNIPTFKCILCEKEKY